PTANRGRSEIEELIGFFVNTLPLRVDLSGSPSIEELLGRVKERALGAQHHQDIPFEQVVELLQPVRSLSHSPVFQVMFAWQNATGGGLELPGLAVGEVDAPEHETAKFDLSLWLYEADGRIAGGLTYATSLFERATVARYAGYLRRVLAAMVAHEGRRVDGIELLPAAERAQVVEEWNATAAAYPADACLHELFEAQVERTPDAVAVVCEDEELTYRELNRRANRLAHFLVGRGVGPDVRVGLCVERSLELMVGLLGVLKAGGAYVPLDPDHPEDRLRYTLIDSGPAVLLTQTWLADRFGGLEVPAVTLDGDASSAWAHQPETNPGRAGLTPDHLAYVIYTSGSTGRPKGVMVAHRSVVNVLTWMSGSWRLAADDAVLQKTPYSFDASLRELMPPLMAGARLVMARPGGHRDPGYLVETIRSRRISTLHFVPSMLQMLVQHPDLGSCTGIERVVCGGEPLSHDLVRRFYGLLPQARLYNVYGPTEAAVDVTAWSCAPEERAGSLPIGRPMANTRIYVLDRLGQPVPVGVVGEVHIGGVQVTRGYHGRAGLTAERFVPDAFGGERGARLYRTGDLGRWLAGGTIEFLGRNDHQVKVRGNRIELGEIEARLVEHPAVREGVVAALGDGTGDQRLVAYYVGEALQAEALRTHLSERLPEYMVPAAYVRLEALPLTPNGKLDRRALPAPESDAYAAREYEAPVGESEQALAEIWSGVLRVERVGRRDHFFELGGHSLLAVQVASRVRQVLGVEVALGDVFVRPVLADFARGLAAAARAELPAIEPADRGGRLAPSFAQQRLWFLEQLGSAGAAYHVFRRLRLTGELDRAALAGALDRIVARHEALRTTFPTLDGEPVQRVAPAAECRFPLVQQDLGGRTEAAAELRRLMAEETSAPFDLERGPLIRGRLVRLAADEHVLLITMHHIVSDAWSMGVFTDELSTLYAAFRRGEPDPLPPLPVQYADYAAWQRRWVDGAGLRRQADYWKETLDGVPELLELPADRARPPRQKHAGASVDLELDEVLTAGLKALGRRHGTTLFMTLLAGWATVLSRLSGQDDVVIGTPTANRGRQEIEGLIGFFINTLALRVDLSGSPTVAEVLGRVKERALGAQHHQDIPFEQVVELLQPVRSLSHSPVFQVLFAWQNAPGGGLELPGLAVGGVETPEHDTAKFDLSLWLYEADGRIAGGLTYATALFEAPTVERYLGYLRRVLEAMADDERRRVDGIELLAAAERAQVVEEWNATDAAYPRDLCIHALIEAQVARTPDAAAVAFEGQTLTYGELNRRANRLAHFLVERGVGPDVRVGLCVERSPEMVVGLLAVLKAGGAYVPLDPSYPADRLAFMLTDSEPAVLLTQASLAERFAGAGPSVVALDAGASSWAHHPETDPEPDGLTPDHLAYVIYTSGSTGRPKGVMNLHRGLVNRLVWGQQAWGLGAYEAVLQNTSLSFDGLVREIFWPLMVGARVVLARPEGQRDPACLLETIARERITTLNLVPSLLQLLVEAPDVEGCRGLTRVLCGGEALSSALLGRLRERLPQVELHNLYGPSEAATAAVALRCTADGARAGVPIGAPVGNTRLYVLDGAGEPVPVGVVGELYIGGAGVARGYQNRPELTAERFVADPFGGEPGARLYRTGDLVRWLADGRLEFVGRNDAQVKVRGFRVELGEIEARLLDHAAVREAVVVAREDASGDRRLVAYCVGADGAVEVEALRAHLSERLPEYMVPAAYVRLQALPLTPNGKLDRRALPAPGEDAYARRPFEAPADPAERALAEIWTQVLRVERVGRWDHFFELGGHSLLAVQVTSRVRQALGVEVALGQVFERPVLADFARGLDTAARAELSAIEPVDRGGRLALSFAQQRLWFLEQLGRVGSTYHVRRRMRLRGALDREALGRALDRIVARHEALRTTFVAVDGEPEQRIAPAEESGFHLAEHDLGEHAGAGAELQRLMAEEADAPFDLARGPLIRGRLIRMAQDDHVLLLTMHHVVSDGWSIGVLVHELGVLYAAFGSGEADPLPPLPVQYADYAAWQRRWMTGEALEAQAAYWTRTLAGAPELLELPADRPRPARQDHAGAWLDLELDEALTGALKALGRRQGTTLFMTLLAGWAAVLGRLSGQDDVVVGTPAANRGRREVEGLIGFFVNTLALRVDLAGSPTVAELLARVKSRALEAQRHQDIPFEQVVELLQPVRSLAHSPVFQTVLAWHNTPQETPALPGLELAPVEGESRGTAKFDLSLTLLEADGRIVGRVEYATALFERATVERYLAYLRRVLEGMAADEGRRVERLALLPEAERVQVVQAWNATAAEVPRDACIHELFEAQVERTPGAVAVEFEGEALAYAELNARANRLAHHLRGLGVGPDVRVAICVEPCLEMVAGVLGVLKAGGAYVPLDPAYPGERLRWLLRDSAPAVVLTQSALRERFAGTEVPVVDLGAAGAWSGQTAANPERGALTPEHLAYVIYTSGSTGTPKGVMARHRSV
ncbi:MAG TPA: amino acid adenylation domain-containing protein, partial [Longimicrobium sp.]|nr:amino acid adenylation domain-containing protein [Longimicrobium sp.]